MLQCEMPPNWRNFSRTRGELFCFHHKDFGVTGFQIESKIYPLFLTAGFDTT